MSGAVKISQLDAATSITGAEILPIVQGTVTKKATIDELKLYINPNEAIDNYNYLINGNYDVWQRGTYPWTAGTSLAPAATGRYLADRWLAAAAGSTISPSRQEFSKGQTTVPGNPDYFHRNIVASVAGNLNGAYLAQRIEGVGRFSDVDVAWSFWAKADATRTVAVEFEQVFGSGGSPSNEVAGIGVQKITLTSQWQQFTGTVRIPTVDGKVFGTDPNSTYLGMYIWLDAGSDYAWKTGAMGQQSGTFDFARMQLNLSTVPLAWQIREYGTELNLCKRYFETGNHRSFVVVKNVAGVYPSKSFSVEKRTTPTVLLATLAGSGAQVLADATGFFQSVSHSEDSACGWAAEAEL